MRMLLTSAMCTGLMLIGAGSFADDTDKISAKPSHMQMMKDCMAKQEMKDDGMTKEQMKKSCEDQMKMHKDSMNKDAMPEPTN